MLEGFPDMRRALESIPSTEKENKKGKKEGSRGRQAGRD